MITLEQLQEGIVLPIDKPRQWTSFQVVNKVKAVVRNTYGLKKIKIGHAGTLDPLATGLLLVCLGRATKTIPQLQDGDKVYTGTLVLGATTPCYDLERPIDRHYPYQHITLPLLQQTAQQFVGTIMQVPPMFSAVKIAGQRAYEHARLDELKTENSKLKPKPVNVYSFEITDFRNNVNCEFVNSECVNALSCECVSDRKVDSGECVVDSSRGQVLPTTHYPLPTKLYQNPLGEVPPHLPQADFRIHCGKGTYIRSLARDLGDALGSGAFLAALRREQTGPYTVDKAILPDQVSDYFST